MRKRYLKHNFLKEETDTRLNKLLKDLKAWKNEK